MREEMTKRERVTATMAMQETDRIPVYDIMFNDAAIEYYSGEYPVPGPKGRRAQCRAIAKALDMTRAAGVSPSVPGDTPMDEDGFSLRLDRWTHYGYAKKPFTDMEGALLWLNKKIKRLKGEFDCKAHALQFREDFLSVQQEIGDDTVVLHGASGTGLDELRFALGLELFSYIDADEPGLIEEYLTEYTQRQIQMIHATADAKLSPITLVYGDIAMKNSLLHSPEWLKKHFFPRIGRLIAAWHEHGVKCLFHSDGNLCKVLDCLVECGIDGLNPIETVAGMDVGSVRKRCPDIFIAGGIDMSQLLSNGTPDEVRKASRKAIQDAGRGYFIGSTSELDNSAQLQNIIAMLETARCR